MILCDTHADTLYGRARRPEADFDVTLEKLKAGQVNVQTLALYVGGKADIPSIAKMFDAMWQEAETLKAQGWQQAMDPRDAEEGKTKFMLSVEGCDLLKADETLLASWRKKGVRIAALCWNYENVLCTPACISADAPLKPFGREAAREMQRLGIAADTSHLNERGFWDLLEMGVVPMASHSCARALCDHKRNLTDDQLKALFEAGGYVGVNFYPAFLSADGQADVERVCDHVVHMLEMGGEGHIGFGSDFDGIERKPVGLDGPQDFPKLIRALRARGLDEALIEGIAGQNLLRYFDQIDPR